MQAKMNLQMRMRMKQEEEEEEGLLVRNEGYSRSLVEDKLDDHSV
jgi:hypothetical protein